MLLYIPSTLRQLKVLKDNAVVEISFDKVVGYSFHKFSNPRGATTVGAKQRNFANLTCSAPSKLLRLLQIFFLSSVAGSNWWPWIWVHGKMCKKSFQSLLPLRCSSLQQELKYLHLPCSWNLISNNWIGHMVEVIIMQLPNLLRLDYSQCSAEKKLKV